MDALGAQKIAKKYADQLQKIYDERTAGDYTFEGVLFEYTQELRAWVDSNKA